MTIFERLRSVSAREVAEQMRIPMQQKGNKVWMRCQSSDHTGDNTPSLAIFPDGHFYCFGCHKSGDAVAFYQMCQGGTPYEAAKSVASMLGISDYDTGEYTPKPSVYKLQEKLERYRSERITHLEKLHSAVLKAQERVLAYLSSIPTTEQLEERTTEFEDIVAAGIHLEEEIHQLEISSLTDLARDYVMEVKSNDNE